MKEELYRKEGRKYVRVNDPWAYDGLREGHYHVWVRSNSVTIRQPVLPDRRGVAAAIEEVREAMVAAMMEANKAVPRVRGITEKETRAIAAYREVVGEDVDLTFEGISVQGLVDAGVKILVNHFKGE